MSVFVAELCRALDETEQLLAELTVMLRPQRTDAAHTANAIAAVDHNSQETVTEANR